MFRPGLSASISSALASFFATKYSITRQRSAGEANHSILSTPKGLLVKPSRESGVLEREERKTYFSSPARLRYSRAAEVPDLSLNISEVFRKGLRRPGSECPSAPRSASMVRLPSAEIRASEAVLSLSEIIIAARVCAVSGEPAGQSRRRPVGRDLSSAASL